MVLRWSIFTERTCQQHDPKMTQQGLQHKKFNINLPSSIKQKLWLVWEWTNLVHTDVKLNYPCMPWAGWALMLFRLILQSLWVNLLSCVLRIWVWIFFAMRTRPFLNAHNEAFYMRPKTMLWTFIKLNHFAKSWIKIKVSIIKS